MPFSEDFELRITEPVGVNPGVTIPRVVSQKWRHSPRRSRGGDHRRHGLGLVVVGQRKRSDTSLLMATLAVLSDNRSDFTMPGRVGDNACIRGEVLLGSTGSE